MFYGGEPRAGWSEQDRVWALALAEVEGSECPDCHRPVDEAHDPMSEGQWVSPPPVRCHACTAVAARASTYANVPYPQALRFRVERHQEGG